MLQDIENKAISLDSFNFLKKVVRSGSYKRAAAAIGCSVANVKKNIFQLEEKLKFKIFVPESEGKTLTAAGLFLYDNLESIFSSLEVSIVQAQNIPEEKSLSLSIAVSEMIAANSYGELLKRFSKEHPEIHLTLSSLHWLDLRRKLVDGSLDLAITFSEGLTEEPLFIRKPVFRSSPCIVYHNDLFPKDKNPESLDDFRDCTFVSYDKNIMIMQLESFLNFKPKKTILVDSLKSLQLYVKSGLACAVVGPAQQLMNDADISKYMLRDTGSTTGADLIWDGNNNNPAKTLFLECADRVYNLK